MKQLTQIFAAILFALLLFNVNSFAQNDPNSLLVCSFNKVNLVDVGKVNKMADSVFSPILKELTDEGFIYGYGQFNHAWGDEWNVNFWYDAKDMESFSKFWSEYVKRVGERHPGVWAATVKYFQAHKDNMYVIRNQYSAPPMAEE
jgi:hypothetical protein